MSTAESSAGKSHTSPILGHMRLLYKMLQLRPQAEQSSVSQVGPIAPPEIPECTAQQETLDEAGRAVDAAVANLKWALRELLACQSQGSVIVLSTEQEAALDLALELVAYAIA